MVELIGEGGEQSPQLSIACLWQTLAVSRAASYRWEPLGPTTDADMEARDQIQHIALEMPAYGYRRLTHERPRRGRIINHSAKAHGSFH